jgi:hypothetical protein
MISAADVVADRLAQLPMVDPRDLAILARAVEAAVKR